MKRVAVIVLALGLLVGAFVLWQAEEEPVAGFSGDAAEAKRASGSQADPSGATPRTGGVVSGVVTQSGQPAVGARVVLKGTQTLVATSGLDGAFSFESVTAGSLYLSATLGAATSEVVGPLVLEPMGTVAGVALSLKPAVEVSGRVLDLVTKKPIAKATIVTPAGVKQAGDDGVFQLVGPKAETWLEISAPGYLSRTEWVSMQLTRAGARLEIVLTPSSHVEGTVLDSGSPIARATVWVEGADSVHAGSRSAMVFTDAKGHFDIECAAGVVVPVAATPGGTRVRGAVLTLALGERKTGVVLEIVDATAISGLIMKDGQPFAGALVGIVDARTEDIVTTTTTGPTGQFRTGAVMLGRYVAQVRRDAFTGIGGPFDHRGDGTSWNMSFAGAGKVSGRVEPAGAGVRIRLRSGEWSGPVPETATDAEGKFTFDGAPSGFFALEAEGPSGAATVRAKAGDDVVLRLEHGGVVVHLQDDSGAAVTDGVLTARSLETGSVRRFLVLAPDGVYRLELPNGAWELKLEVAGRGRSAPMKISVTPAGVEVHISLEVSAAAEGTVIDSATQLPVSGALVRVIDRAGNEASLTASVLTDDRGRFTTPPAPRSALLSVSRNGFKPRWVPLVEFGANASIPLERAAHPAQERVSESFEGIGMTLDPRSGRMLAIEVLPGSPAERAGVQKGDVVIAVEGAPAGADVGALVARIRGPAGTPVRITFERNGQVFDVTIRRKQITPI